MKNINESEIKYLAGLLDADGSLSFKFSKTSTGKTYLYLILALSASKSIDRQDYLGSLGERVGSVCQIKYEKETHNDAQKWHVQKRSELNQLLPRILKHMVIKGAHWNRLYQIYCDKKGEDVTSIVDELKKYSQDSRKSSGPISDKKHPTWAWVAGYLDGDGCYTLSKRAVHVGAITDPSDNVGIKLLNKAFGGTIYEPREDNSQLWRRGMGRSHKDFAVNFLKKVHRHSRLKKWKIEQMLSFHNQPQRLSDTTPEGEAIV